MVLTVIVPDDRPGMQRMLAGELQNINNQIIYDTWRSGLEKARGDFILLLEHDSAIERGGVERLLYPFLENPHFRKLAMVSPMVEFEDTDPTSLSYHDTFLSSGYHSVRYGSIAGAIIRQHSLMKYAHLLVDDVIDSSYDISLEFWEHGLRVMNDPQALYYSPSTWSSYVKKNKAVSDKLKTLWEQECVA